MSAQPRAPAVMLACLRKQFHIGRASSDLEREGAGGGGGGRPLNLGGWLSVMPIRLVQICTT